MISIFKKTDSPILQKATRFLYLFLFLVIFSHPAHSQSVYVPLNHWSYEFLERLETQKVISGVHNGTRPISRKEMARYLVQAIEKVRAGEQLNSVQQDQLNFLKLEFYEELKSLIEIDRSAISTRISTYKKLGIIDKMFPDFIYRNNRNFLNWQSAEFSCYLDPLFLREADFATGDTISGTERVYQNSNGFTFWGNLGTHLGFYFNTRDTKESGTRIYPTQYRITGERLGFVNGYGTHIYHDETISYLMFKLPYFDLQFGKDVNAWGPGYHGNLALSDYATSYDQIKFQTRFWRIKFTSLTGFLRAYPNIFENGRRLERSLAAHRLEINLGRAVQLGLYETVIYGGRKLEPAYLNPIMFYRSAEHFLGDRDNVAIGGDIDLVPIKNWKFYGELFIDDITTTKLGTGYYGNKIGYLTGLYTIDLFGLDNFDLRAEYARVRPYVYSHKYPITSYQHFSTGLGHKIGANSDDLFVEWRYRSSKSLVASFTAEFQRIGHDADSTNYGRKINFDHNLKIPTYLNTLDGRRETIQSYSIGLSYELFREVYIKLEYLKAFVTGHPITTHTSKNFDTSKFAIKLSINY